MSGVLSGYRALSGGLNVVSSEPNAQRTCVDKAPLLAVFYAIRCVSSLGEIKSYKRLANKFAAISKSTTLATLGYLPASAKLLLSLPFRVVQRSRERNAVAIKLTRVIYVRRQAFLSAAAGRFKV